MKFKQVALIGAVVLAGIGLAVGSNSNDDTQGGAKVTEVAKSSHSAKPKIKYYKVGDTVKVGNVEYTLKSVTTTSYRNQFADEKPKHVIKVVYHVKNDSKKDLPIGTDLNVYGPDNSKLKSYPVDDSTFDAIAPDKEADVTTGFGTKKLGNFELQFAPLVSNEKAAKFRAVVK